MGSPGSSVGERTISVEARSEDFLSQAVCRLSGMDWGKLTEVQLDELIVRAEGEIASWRAVQMAAVGEKRSRGSHDGMGTGRLSNGWRRGPMCLRRRPVASVGPAPAWRRLPRRRSSWPRARSASIGWSSWPGSHWSSVAGMRVVTSPNLRRLVPIIGA